MKISVLSCKEIIEKLSQKPSASYPCFFSSYLGGISFQSEFLLIPVDDHLVHRGDGVFEAVKVHKRKPILLDQHLERMQVSAERIGLKLYHNISVMKDIILQTIAASNLDSSVLRIFLSRGRGSFTPNPYETEGSAFFVVVTNYKPLPLSMYEAGVRIGRAVTPVKESWLAQIKTCNYLPNVMMKKEAVDRGLDYTIAFDEENHLAESATENCVIVTKDGILLRPKLKNILKGATMIKAFELAEGLCLTQEKDISEEEIFSAQEVILMGTTLDVLPVTEYEGKKISDGKVGPIARELLKRYQNFLNL